jgi:hypothetical protein
VTRKPADLAAAVAARLDAIERAAAARHRELVERLDRIEAVRAARHREVVWHLETIAEALSGVSECSVSDQAPAGPKLLSVKDAARRVGRSRCTILRWLATCTGLGTPIAGQWVVHVDVLDAEARRRKR